MPIIEIRFIEGVVAPEPEQKRQLIERLTEDFIQICGEVTRPFVYCIIHETPPLEWGISGVPMPDLAYLTGERRAEEIGEQITHERNGGATKGGATATSTPRQYTFDMTLGGYSLIRYCIGARYVYGTEQSDHPSLAGGRVDQWQSGGCRRTD